MHLHNLSSLTLAQLTWHFLQKSCKFVYISEKNPFSAFKNLRMTQVVVWLCTWEIQALIPFMNSNLSSQSPFQALGTPFWKNNFHIGTSYSRGSKCLCKWKPWGNIWKERIIARLWCRNEIGNHLSFSLISIFHHPHGCLCSFLKEQRLLHSPLLERDFKKQSDPSQGECWSSFSSNHSP